MLCGSIHVPLICHVPKLRDRKALRFAALREAAGAAVAAEGWQSSAPRSVEGSACFDSACLQGAHVEGTVILSRCVAIEAMYQMPPNLAVCTLLAVRQRSPKGICM